MSRVVPLDENERWREYNKNISRKEMRRNCAAFAEAFAYYARISSLALCTLEEKPFVIRYYKQETRRNKTTRRAF